MSEHDHYRSLFEGSQASLADMAARQAQALSRVGRLRSAIVAVLRKNFMELSAQAEANLGGRLSEVDDEILLAYLDAFTAAASRGDQRATIQALKEAVMTLGIPLRGDEPLVWVEQIHQHRQQNRPSVTKPDATAHDTEEPTVAAGRVRPPLITSGDPAGDDVFADRDTVLAERDDEPAVPATNQPLPVDDYWKWDDSTPLGDLFDDVDKPQNPAQDEAPRRWGNDLGTIASDEERWTPSPIAPGSTPRTGPAPTPAVALEPEETIRPKISPAVSPAANAASPTARPSSAPPTTSSVVQQGAEPAATGDGSIEKPVVKPAKKATKRQPRRRATAPGETAAEPVTIDETAPPTTPSTTPSTAPVVPVAPLATAATTDQQVRVTEPSTAATGEDLSALFEDVPSTETPGANTFVAPPMRPELFTPNAPKRRRGARTKVTAPITEIPLTEGVAPQELNDGMRTALLAAASIPRPVFTRDLIGVAGSLAMVDAWEAECRADVSSSPVRFVAPKSRHRLRGHLVAVEPTVVRPGDWWYQAVQRYRAGRLYELAVLLHRVGDEIVSFTLEDQLAVFHLNTPRGLVGMIVVLDPRPIVGGASSAELATHLEKLLSERLTMIAVLTASAEPGSLESLISHVEDLAGRRQWQPTAPVIAARSWEYADDRGTSAVMVLGQS